MNLTNKDVLGVIQEEPLKLCVGGLDSKHYFTPGSKLQTCMNIGWNPHFTDEVSARWAAILSIPIESFP